MDWVMLRSRGKELLHNFYWQIGKGNLTVSFPRKFVLVVPRFVPQYLFAKRIKGVLDVFFVRMRLHVFTSLRIRKGG